MVVQAGEAPAVVGLEPWVGTGREERAGNLRWCSSTTFREWEQSKATFMSKTVPMSVSQSQ